MTDVKEIRRKLWDSLDMVCVKRWLFIGVVCLILGLVIGNLSMPDYMDTGFKVTATLIVTGIISFPILAFCLWRTYRIFRHAESYFFCKTVMSSPKGGNVRDTIRFTVVLEDPDGGKFVATTHSIFDTHGSSVLAFENYVNRTVTIAYNEETDVVVVIGGSI